jgi:hypothetical protein
MNGKVYSCPSNITLLRFEICNKKFQCHRVTCFSSAVPSLDLCSSQHTSGSVRVVMFYHLYLGYPIKSTQKQVKFDITLKITYSNAIWYIYFLAFSVANANVMRFYRRLSLSLLYSLKYWRRFIHKKPLVILTKCMEWSYSEMQ